MCEQPCADQLSRRTLLATSGVVAAGTLRPGVAFAGQPGPDAEQTAEQTRTVTGTLPADVPDWYYVVLADELTPRRLMEAFKAGRNWIAESSSVRLHFAVADGIGQAGIGDRLVTDAGALVTVEMTVDGVPGTSVRFLNQNGPQWIEAVGQSGTKSVRWTTQTRYSQWVRAEVRRQVPTATTSDTMVALTNPIFLSSR